MRTSSLSFAASLATLAAGTLICASVAAQQVYRIVGPDGRVTFSDQAPADPKTRTAPALLKSNNGNGALLPFDLMQTSSKFPVTIYTSPNCGSCVSGRAYLASRGIPFTEKTVISAEDIEALQRLAGESLVPIITIGGQMIRGFSASEWQQYLDIAGFPTKSMLPRSWTYPAPTPLVAVERALPLAEPSVTRELSSPSPIPSTETSYNPANIKF